MQRDKYPPVSMKIERVNPCIIYRHIILYKVGGRGERASLRRPVTVEGVPAAYGVIGEREVGDET